jgi:hypothetical protein
LRHAFAASRNLPQAVLHYSNTPALHKIMTQAKTAPAMMIL